MPIEIKVLTENLYSEYQRFILSYETSLIYHSTKYKIFLENLLDCRSNYLLAYENGHICAALPLMIKDGPYGKVINSLPFYGSNGGLLGACNHEIVCEFRKEILSMEFSSLTLISSPFSNTVNNLFNEVSDQRYSQITPLKTNEDPENYILSIIDSSARRNIRKAIKEGIKISFDNMLGLDFLIETHKNNMSVIGGKAKNNLFFTEFPKCFEVDKDFNIATAYFDGKPVAALLIFLFNKTVEYFIPVIKEEFRDKQPLSLIIFESMKESITNGYHYWNWGGTWLSQKGVYQFKKKWAAIERIYNYTTILNRADMQSECNLELLQYYDGFYIYNFNRE